MTTRQYCSRRDGVLPWIAFAVAVVLASPAANSVAADEAAASGNPPSERTAANSGLRSGPRRGATIHQFFVRAVTGPHRNRSVCYVCRYGARPVVMVLIQKVDPEIATLLKAIDKVVDENRVKGLRSFGVLVTDESSKAVPILQTMAFDEQIRMPLTSATTAVAGASCHNLHKEAATTVVLYRNQQAEKNVVFGLGRIDTMSVNQLTQQIRRLIEPGT